MARTTYTAEFKLQALKMMADQGLSVAEVARRLGIRENLIRNWKRAAKEHGADAFPGHGHLPPAEVARLKAERDLLKQAAAYFASPPA